MGREEEVKELLISNAIHLIAEGGFEKATTKELTHCNGNLPNFKMNEVYIYRYFGSKESLYECAFFRLDEELFQMFLRALRAVGEYDCDFHERMYRLFLKAWEFLLGNEERCRCYVRYYYSIYFKGSSRASHQKHFDTVVSAVAPSFKAEADVGAIMHSVFTALLDFAVRVYNGELKDSEENRPHIFNVLYCMIMTYLKEPIAPLRV